MKGGKEYRGIYYEIVEDAAGYEIAVYTDKVSVLVDGHYETEREAVRNAEKYIDEYWSKEEVEEIE
jgi:hypothetical protein